MNFVAWIVVGAIAGFLANQVMGSREGLLMMVVLGIVGGLVGGTTSQRGFVISITAIGEVAPDTYVKRDGAKVNDLVCVSRRCRRLRPRWR